MTAEPMWFGRSGRPLFGWLHVPDSGIARAGAVLCPPLGDEDRRAYSTYRKLAETLVCSGVAALRFSYDGTGDSAGTTDDPHRVDAWLTSITEAVTTMRDLGLRHIVVVGMRLGATLATHALPAMTEPVDEVVLWDPCVSGHEFLRYQKALMAALPGQSPTVGPGVGLPGFSLPSEEIEVLDDLVITPVLAPGTRTLLLTRPQRSTRRLDAALGSSSVERMDAEGQEQLLDVPPLSAAIPWATIKEITDWVDRSVPDITSGVTIPDETTAIVGVDTRGLPIRERAIRMGTVGLFGIVTEPEPEPAPEPGGRGPWIVFTNVATEHHVGPGRQWVELARLWARSGVRSVRFDASGVGDSPVHPGQSEGITYAPEWLDDLPMVATEVTEGKPADTVWIGLCSGGYSALEAGISIGALGACVLNPSLSSASMNKASAQADPRRKAFRPLPVRLVRLAVDHGRTAHWLWDAYCQVAVGQAPLSVPAAVVREGLDVLMICGPEDVKQLRRAWYWRVFGERRLGRTGRFALAVVPSMDHALLRGDGRMAASAILSEHVLTRYGTVDRAEVTPIRSEAVPNTDQGASIKTHAR